MCNTTKDTPCQTALKLAESRKVSSFYRTGLEQIQEEVEAYFAYPDAEPQMHEMLERIRVILDTTLLNK